MVKSKKGGRIVGWLWLFMAIVGVAGCQTHMSRDGDKADDPSVITGKVVRVQRAGVERWVFAPDDQPGTYVRVTEMRVQGAASPESNEVDLSRFAGQRIQIKGVRSVQGDWLYVPQFIGGPVKGIR